MKSFVFNQGIGQRMVTGWLLATCSLLASVSLAADVHIGVNVAAAQQVPLSAIDHSAWDTLLKRHVDDRGMVDYRSWKASAGDTQALDAYLNQLSHSSGQGSHEEKLAFWINAPLNAWGLVVFISRRALAHGFQVGYLLKNRSLARCG